MTSLASAGGTHPRVDPVPLPAALRRPVERFLQSPGPLVLVTILGALLRGYRLGANSLWVDEFATLKIVSRPFAQILSATADVNFCPPLYFWLVHGVVAVTGPSEAGLRLVSAVAGTLTIPVAWLLTRELSRSRRIADLCAVLLALNPLHIWYAQEARPYALLVGLGLASLLCLVVALRTRTRGSWAAYVAITTAVMLTHSIGPLFLAVAFVWVILWPRRAGVLRSFAGATLVIVALSAPFALVVMRAVGQANGDTHSPSRPLTGLELPYTLATYVGGFSFGPALRDIQNLGPLAAVRLHLAESVLSGILLVALLLLVLRYSAPTRKHFVTLLLIPIVAMLLASSTSGKAYQARYALGGLAGFCGLVATALHLAPRRIGILGLTATVGLATAADVQWYTEPTYWKDDSRAMVTWLAERLPPGSMVAVAPGYAGGVLSYYASRQGAQLGFVAAEDSANPPEAAALLLTRLHHVPEAASLEDRFRRMAGGKTEDVAVGGYTVIVRLARDTERRRD